MKSEIPLRQVRTESLSADLGLLAFCPKIYLVTSSHYPTVAPSQFACQKQSVIPLQRLQRRFSFPKSILVYDLLTTVFSALRLMVDPVTAGLAAAGALNALAQAVAKLSAAFQALQKQRVSDSWTFDRLQRLHSKLQDRGKLLDDPLAYLLLKLPVIDSMWEVFTPNNTENGEGDEEEEGPECVVASIISTERRSVG